MIRIRSFFAGKILCLAGALSLAAAPAAAQEISLGFSKHTRHGSFHVSIGSPAVTIGGPGYGGHWKPGYGPAKKTWVNGHYEVRYEKVWVNGNCEKIWHAPVYETRTTYAGHCYKVLVRDGWWETIETPGHFETVKTKVWVPGAWIKC